MKNGQLKWAGVAKEICPHCHKDHNVIHILHKYRENLLSSSLLSKNLKIKIYKTVILSVVLYGYETWLLTLREERRLRVFENRVLRRIFGPKRDKVTWVQKKLHNEELKHLYYSPNIAWMIKSRIRWAGHVAQMVERYIHSFGGET
jgi:hypothetical protein